MKYAEAIQRDSEKIRGIKIKRLNSPAMQREGLLISTLPYTEARKAKTAGI